MKILIISGFLGAGKTTFIKTLAQKTGKDFAILENEYERISLLSPITIVDFHSYERYRRDFPDLYRDQIASAHTVIVSKTEQAGIKEKDILRKYLEKWNPDGDIITEHYSTLDKKWYMNLLERGFDGKIYRSPQNEAQDLSCYYGLRGKCFGSF